MLHLTSVRGHALTSIDTAARARCARLALGARWPRSRAPLAARGGRDAVLAPERATGTKDRRGLFGACAWGSEGGAVDTGGFAGDHGGAPGILTSGPVSASRQT